MQLIDTHSHIYEKEFSKDLDKVIERLETQKIYKVLLPNIDSSTIQPMLLLKNKRPDIFYTMIGLHPTSVKENFKDELNILYNYHLSKSTYCAIGEIGIDLYWDQKFEKEQINAFEVQVQVAIEKNMPIVIHTRNSFETVSTSLKKFNSKKLYGIFHSFTGDKKMAEDIFTLGNFKLGINGIITFKNSGLDKTISQLPLERIVLETDAPYLTPVPHRGERNESAYLSFIAQKISQITEKSIEEIAKITTKNAIEIFSL